MERSHHYIRYREQYREFKLYSTNTCGSLGELEIPWKHLLCGFMFPFQFLVLPNFHLAGPYLRWGRGGHGPPEICSEPEDFIFNLSLRTLSLTSSIDKLYTVLSSFWFCLLITWSMKCLIKIFSLVVSHSPHGLVAYLNYHDGLRCFT